MKLGECISTAAAAAAVAWERFNHQEADAEAMAATASFGDAGICFQGWLLNSTTPFYQSEELVVPWWFGLFCFNYTFSGMILWWAKAPWTRQSIFPYTLMCIFLIFIQGPLAFMADYRNMTNDSFYHVIDRCTATLLVFLELWKVYLMRHHVRPSLFRPYLGIVCFSLWSFAKSQQSQLRLNPRGFVIWHNCWHMGPLLASILLAYERILMEKEGKRKRSDSDEEKMVTKTKSAKAAANQTTFGAWLRLFYPAKAI